MNEKFAVVTGGSSGIGLELARQFATNGFDVMIVSENAPELDQAARELSGPGAARIETVVADLTKFEEVEKVAGAIRSTGRPVDAIALNAGMGVAGDFVRTTKLEDELYSIALNVNSTVHLAKRVLPDMLARNAGRVLITCSVDSVEPAPYQAVYGATKAFLLMFSEALREELKETEISVTAVMPGVTDTNFFESPGFDNNTAGQMAEKKKADDPADVARRSFEALMKNKDRAYVGSFIWRFMGKMNEYTPKGLSATLHRPLSEPHDQDKVERQQPAGGDASVR